MEHLTNEQLIRIVTVFRGAYIPATMRETMLAFERELLRRGVEL